MNVRDNAVLRISYIGYLKQEIASEGKSTVNVTLIEDTRALEELYCSWVWSPKEGKS